MKSYNLYDVGSQSISDRFKKATPAKVKSLLFTLDPICPKRAYLKLSRILEVCDSRLITGLFYQPI